MTTINRREFIGKTTKTALATAAASSAFSINVLGANERVVLCVAGIHGRGSWLAPEFAKRKVDRYISTAHGWYITVGHRIDAFTPYLTYANQTQDNPAGPAGPACRSAPGRTGHRRRAVPGLSGGCRAPRVALSSRRRPPP